MKLRNASIGVLALGAASAAAEAREPLNLVVVMADQWRGDALGFLGKEAVRTPNIDQFAKAGIVVGQCVSGYPVSSPARGMFMTGAYPHVNGVTGNCNSNTAPFGVELRNEVQCWSDVLAAQGYSLGYIGKWHLDSPYTPYIDCSNNKGAVAWNEWCPPDRRHGFGYWVAYGTYDQHLRPLYWHNATDRNDWRYVDQWGPEYEADLAIEFIQNNAQRPFALMVSMNPPHPGYNLVPDRYKEMYKDLNVDSIAATRPNLADGGKLMKQVLRDYYACMTGVDEQFGRIVAALKAAGLWERTVVVFTSDHGDIMGAHGVVGKNTFHEESMRVPMIWGGAGLKPRVDNELLMSLEDFSPTALGLLGYGTLLPSTTQTRNLAAQLQGDKKNRPEGQLYMKMWSLGGEGMGGAQEGIALHVDGWRGWRTDRYTYAVQWMGGKVVDRRLFDRSSDPYQLQNIAQAQPRVVEQMHRALGRRLKEIGDPIAANL